MSKFGWNFPLRNGGTIQGYNDGGIATFKGTDLYNNLAREICQNSLDAKADDKKHVVVKFALQSISKKKYQALNEFDEIINSCKNCWGTSDNKFASFINDAENLLNNDKIDFLVISDYNTKGLTGAKNYSNPETVWAALAHSTGVTNKSSGGSGGSYGIGKSAPFACSLLRTVFYNTFAIDGVKAFQGVSRLVTHKNTNGEDTQGDGYYQNIESFVPIYGEDSCDIRDCFPRTEYGTDVIIAGFKFDENWEDVIKKAVIKNFFVAIHEGTLIVKIGNYEINSTTLPILLQQYSDEEKEDIDSTKELVIIRELYETLVSPEHEVFKTQIIEPDDLVVYFKKGDDYSKKIGEMRSIGMLVRTRGRNVIPRFAALVIARGAELSKQLKEMEPPKHDEWDADIIEDPKARKNAKQIRSSIIRWVNSTIGDLCKTEYQEFIDPDGISQFLPLELDDDTNIGSIGKSNIPDGEMQLGEIKKRNLKMKSSLSNSINTIGLSNGGTGRNNSSGGTHHNPGGVRDPQGNQKVHVEKEKGKNKVENSPKVLFQRSYPISSNYDIYKTIIMLEEDNDKVYIAARAIGDDGKSEQLDIIEYTIDSVRKGVKNNVIGPLDLKANVKYNIFIKLAIKERLLINIIVS